MRKLFFIYNPLSGKASLKPKIGEIIDVFTKAGYVVTAYPTQYPADCIEKVELACEQDFELIVCSGGDGTLNESIHGIMNSSRKVPLGYIPTGTTNDFARSLGIPRRIIKAAEWLIYGCPFSCDVGSFNNSYFTYIAAFGAFTEVSYETPQQIKNIMGHAAYVLEGLRRMRSIKAYHMKIEYDGNTIEDDYVFGMVTNSASVAGFLSQNNVLLDDGLYEVTLIKKPSSVAELQLIVTSLLNLNPEKINNNVSWFRTSKIKFISKENITWTLDGEFGGSEKEVCIVNNNMAVDFLISKQPTFLSINSNPDDFPYNTNEVDDDDEEEVSQAL